MIKINLLPYRAERKKRIITRQVFLGAVPLLVVCFIIGIFWWSLNSEYTEVVENISVVKAKIKKSKLKMKDIENFKAQKEKLAKKMDIIKTLDKNKAGPVRLLDEISTRLPGNLWLVSLEQKGSSLQLKGRATDNLSISRYMLKLEESAYFDNVLLGQIKTSKKASQRGGLQIKEFELTSQILYTKKQIKPAG